MIAVKGDRCNILLPALSSAAAAAADVLDVFTPIWLKKLAEEAG